MVKFTQLSGKEVYVNPANVTFVEEAPNGTIIGVVGMQRELAVKEGAKEVATRLDLEVAQTSAEVETRKRRGVE